jgi:hypothetical protein
MGLLNSHQILPGARKPGNYVGSKTYALAGLLDKPTSSVSGSVLSLGTSGSVEIEGTKYAINGTSHKPNTFDFATVVTLLTSGRDYIVSLVPKYLEPTSRSAAEALTPPVNYTIGMSSTNEALLSYFLPSDVEAAVAGVGGVQELQKRIFMGTATTSDITVYNYYSEEIQKLSDPRFTGKLLSPIGYEFVLAEVYDQDNSGVPDVMAKPGFDQTAFNLLKATQGEIPVQRKIMLESAAATAYNSKLWKVQSAKRYSTAKQDALVDLNGVVVPLTGAPFNASGTSYVAVNEYYFPTFMPEGHVGREVGQYKFLAKEQSSALGRINPIYLDNPFNIARTAMSPNPKPALTLYGDPVALVRVNVALSGGAVSALTKVSDVYDMLIGG